MAGIVSGNVLDILSIPLNKMQGDMTMESVFKNDTTEDLTDMLVNTHQRKEALREELESCDDCIIDITAELKKRQDGLSMINVFDSVNRIEQS